MYKVVCEIQRNHILRLAICMHDTIESLGGFSGPSTALWKFKTLFQINQAKMSQTHMAFLLFFAFAWIIG